MQNPCFFIMQTAFYRCSLPDGLFAGSGDPLLRQPGGNGVGGFPLEQLPVDALDGFRFLRHDLRQSVGALAALGGLQKQVLCLRRIAVPLDDSGSDLRHGAVAAAFWNGSLKAGKHLLIFPVVQKCIQRDRTGMADHLRIFRAKQKPCGIRGIGIEERKYQQQTLLQRRMYETACTLKNQENSTITSPQWGCGRTKGSVIIMTIFYRVLWPQ